MAIGVGLPQLPHIGGINFLPQLPSLAGTSKPLPRPMFSTSDCCTCTATDEAGFCVNSDCSSCDNGGGGGSGSGGASPCAPDDAVCQCFYYGVGCTPVSSGYPPPPPSGGSGGSGSSTTQGGTGESIIDCVKRCGINLADPSVFTCITACNAAGKTGTAISGALSWLDWLRWAMLILGLIAIIGAIYLFKPALVAVPVNAARSAVGA